MIDLTALDRYRILHHSGERGDHTCGAFLVPDLLGQRTLRVIAANGEDWDHISVSREHSIPSWDDMDHVARMFLRDHEYGMQLHVPRASHINCHPYVLHIWRPHCHTIPTPPIWMI